MNRFIRPSNFLLLLATIFSFSLSAHGQKIPLKLAGIFGDRMVLQQQTAAPIWGQAKPGSQVSIKPSWSTEVHHTQVDANGRWRTKIQTPAAGGPFNISVNCDGQTINLADVLAGEVWICSGQSNMQWKLSGFGVNQFKEDVEKANFPGIRFCNVPQVLALEEQDDVQTKWSVCNPTSAMQFSAVAYFFGSRLHQELDVPIGLISTNWGGTHAEAWVSTESLAREFQEFKADINDYPRLVNEFGVLHPRNKKMPPGVNQNKPAVLYNNMIRPLIPFSIKGVIWYQGESNVEQPEQYRKLFPALIRDWRSQWGIGEFPFYFVQIAPFTYQKKRCDSAFLREAQLMTLAEPNTGMAVTMDIGDPTNIHPKQKKPVGERLALLALARDYGKQGLVDSGPFFSGFKIEDNQIRLEFDHIEGGLISSNGKALSHFTIAGTDQKFVPATATIDGTTIVVRSDNVLEPIAVRFGWGDADIPNLANKAGLPASSFRTDDWPVPENKQAK